MNYSLRTQTPAPRGSTLRVSRHDNAYFHFNAGVKSVEQSGDELIITTQDGSRLVTDFLILGTGFTVDPLARKELEAYADKSCSGAIAIHLRPVKKIKNSAIILISQRISLSARKRQARLRGWLISTVSMPVRRPVLAS